jgi:hypothetical protein
MVSKLIGIASVAALSAIAFAALAAYRPAASPQPRAADRAADKAPQAAKADAEPCSAARCEKPGHPAKEEDHDRDND